jgi:hypothetical protein
MRKGTQAVRALILLVAFSIGLAGQAFAFTPMIVAGDDAQGPAMVASMADMENCADCAGGNSSDNPSKSLPSSCSLAFCSASVTPAVLPQAPAILRSEPASFTRSLTDRVWGIAIRPALGPPRTSNHA